jgi:hypothetical protein
MKAQAKTGGLAAPGFFLHRQHQENIASAISTSTTTATTTRTSHVRPA